MSGILKENNIIVMYFYKYDSLSILECQDVFYDIIYYFIIRVRCFEVSIFDVNNFFH